MRKSVPIQLKSFFLLLFAATCLSVTSFTIVPLMDQQQWLIWCNKTLVQSYDYFASNNVKKSDLNVTPDGFIRFRKTYMNNKQEYFSFHVHRFKDIDFTGTAEAGTLRLVTLTDDIIVQTYEDPQGDLDSMATSLNLPVRNFQPEQIDSLRMGMLYLKANL